MASDYGLNFGFRRSDECVRVSEGRFKTPVAGPALLIGTAVSIDPASPGYLKACAANAPLVPGYAGILVQEEIQNFSVYSGLIIDSWALGIAKLNAPAVVSTGAGTKVWFKNGAAATAVDGRVHAAVTIFDSVAGTIVGDALGWDGTKWAKSATAKWMTVTAVNLTTGYVEAVLTA